MIRHVSLDFWNTLAHGNPLFAAARKEFLAQHTGLPLEEVEAVYRRLKDGADQNAERAGIGLSSVATYEQFMSEIGRPDDNWWSLREGLERLFRKYPPLVPDAVPKALRRLQARGIGLSIASNTNFVRGFCLNNTTLRPWGLDWAFQVFSDEVSCSKPHPHFWRVVTVRALAHTDARPEEVLHIGDNKICDGGCVTARLQFAHVNSPADLAALLESIH